MRAIVKWIRGPSAAQIDKLIANQEKLMADFSTLTAAVTDLTTKTDTALADFAAKIAKLGANQVDPVALQAVQDAVTSLASKVVAADPGPQA